jgi:curved DNA-binding protein CbpA
MSDRERDPYQELGIGRDATAADIARAWRRLARAVHPDS